ncbi:hypothetical protein PP459_gp068 [Streptomyces phage Wakanda]|uniref:DUF2637 domain-containing protein n=2 Tax=Wakandavirus TaxID=3044854 RepID=A0A6G8R447_9CAUD|nr:hypothetical protein PP459_gp068 [Streptomyces phage Wakanda]YP_010652484.1 hypothetical protein PP460_gp074 [Streptomyces phage Muntaha]QIN94165.1 hypothetical protein SEA_WAKANDA_204 [Streptomyces phage Wakanda]QIN94728.1 hypothetical protein SEA_MUNTAHA_204 [Streptomyces phage Muntaha]
MEKIDIRKGLGIAYAASFVIALMAALAVSTWSLHHLGHTFFDLPELLSWVVSGIFDVGALGAAILATLYALDGESGGKGKFIAFLMIAVSAFLNAQHALMLGHGYIAALLYAAPSIAAGFLLDLFLDWLKSGSLRARGRVHKEFPLVRHATMLYNPKKWIGFYRKGLEIDLKVAELALEDRLSNLVEVTEKPEPKAIKATVTRLDTAKKKPVEKKAEPKAIEAPKKPRTKKVQDPDSGAIIGLSAFKGVPKNMSHAKLVNLAMEAGVRDRDLIEQAIGLHTGKVPARSTLNAYYSRWMRAHKDLPTGMYL